MFQNVQEKVIEALAIVDSNLWYVAYLSDRCIRKSMVKSNSVGLQSFLGPVISYHRFCKNVYCISYLKESLVLSSNEGVSRVILDTNQVIHHIGVGFKPMYIAPFKDGFLFTTSNDSQLFYCNFDEAQTFAGGEERSSRDGTALYSRFYTPTGIAVEFDNFVYVSDSSTGSVKLVTPLKRTAEFLDVLHSLAKTFSLHEKHASYSLKTIDEAIKLVEQCVSVIHNKVDHIRHGRNIGLKSLNGPERSVSAATVDSLHLLDFRLRQLKNNTEKLGYGNINLLNCMTLSFENLHSTVNKKHGTQTVLSYAQSFASSMKESVKR